MHLWDFYKYAAHKRLKIRIYDIYGTRNGVRHFFRQLLVEITLQKL